MAYECVCKGVGALLLQSLCDLVAGHTLGVREDLLCRRETLALSLRRFVVLLTHEIDAHRKILAVFRCLVHSFD